MSSKGSRNASRASSSAFPTVWSQWEWSADYGCHVRYRLKAPNDYEYEYGPVQPPEVPRTTSEIESIPEESYTSQQNYTTTSVSSVDTIIAPLATVSLLPRQIQHPQTQRAQKSEPYTDSTANVEAYITTRNPNTTKEKFDPNYKVHAGYEFKLGKVFKILWSEPQGNNGSNAGDSEYSVREGKFGQKFFEKVRRFVIIAKMNGHCICLPIMTYSNQGTNKWGVHARDHTIIWTERPAAFSGEQEKGLTKTPIRVIPSSKRHKLDDASRLNYAKLYTIEFNVKVWFIGKVDVASENVLIADYNLAHPPVPLRGSLAPSSADTVGYTGGATSTYGTTYPAYNGPATYPSSTPGYTATSSAVASAPSAFDVYHARRNSSSQHAGDAEEDHQELGSHEPEDGEPENKKPNPYDEENLYD